MTYEYVPDPSFSELVGKTLVAVEGMEKGSDSVVFRCADGSAFRLHHYQDCCESVTLEDVVGEVRDLIGSPILLAEESTSSDTPEGYEHQYEPESQTWTFYKLATVKGWVDLRWLGESNGYYSESVDFSRA